MDFLKASLNIQSAVDHRNNIFDTFGSQTVVVLCRLSLFIVKYADNTQCHIVNAKSNALFISGTFELKSNLYTWFRSYINRVLYGTPLMEKLNICCDKASSSYISP
jgi:hypothetical protein